MQCSIKVISSYIPVRVQYHSYRQSLRTKWVTMISRSKFEIYYLSSIPWSLMSMVARLRPIREQSEKSTSRHIATIINYTTIISDRRSSKPAIRRNWASASHRTEAENTQSIDIRPPRLPSTSLNWTRRRVWFMTLELRQRPKRLLMSVFLQLTLRKFKRHAEN